MPFLDRQTSAILYACTAAYLLFVFYLALTPLNDKYTLAISESPLHKNAELALLPGEKYTYAAGQGGEGEQLSYKVQKTPGCGGITLLEADSAYCLSESGNLENDPEQYNFTLGNSTGILFLPWMLAVSDDFSWKVSSEYSNGYFNLRAQTNFSSQGKTRAFGRDAYKIVSVSNMAPEPVYYYIDAGKRVLLLATSGNVSIRLASAPFELDESDVPN